MDRLWPLAKGNIGQKRTLWPVYGKGAIQAGIGTDIKQPNIRPKSSLEKIKTPIALN